jgi:hypothetical protein
MEMGSTYAKLMIEVLLNVHALTCMERASGNYQHRKTAAEWLPQLKGLMADLDRELTKGE